MPFLPIDSTIVSNPNRLHLSIIESWMLWPHDEAKRLDAYKAAVAYIGREQNREKVLTSDLLGDILELDSPRLADIHKMVPEAFRHGLMAGTRLMMAISGNDKNGNHLSLADIDKMLRKKFAKQRGNDSKFVNEIWTKYRSVSHLWAAHIQFTEDDKRAVFPCQLREVIEFLGLSEDWRQKGESTKTAPTAPFLLRAGECVRVPETMRFSK